MTMTLLGAYSRSQEGRSGGSPTALLSTQLLRSSVSSRDGNMVAVAVAVINPEPEDPKPYPMLGRSLDPFTPAAGTVLNTSWETDGPVLRVCLLQRIFGRG